MDIFLIGKSFSAARSAAGGICEFLGDYAARHVYRMVMVRLLPVLLKQPELGRYVIPIVPDEDALLVWTVC